MKIIFLDVDGVLNSAEWDTKCALVAGDLTAPAPLLVVRLVAVCQETGAQIVLTSSWRFFPDFVTRLKAMGLPIIDVTPRGDAFGTRAYEIGAWIGARLQDPAFQFVIVDDEPDAGLDQPDRFVQTDSRLGLTAADAARIVGLFTTPES